MKRKISDYILSLGGQPMYSGKLRTMFISDPRSRDIQSIEHAVYAKYGFELPFIIKTVIE